MAWKNGTSETKKPKRSLHIVPADGNLHDFNGVQKWSVAAVQDRYAQYCHEFEVDKPNLPRPKEHTEGKGHWIYPIMEAVIAGIETGDKACIELGVEFVEEDEHFVFGRILKSNTARALRRAPLSSTQIDRLRTRIVKMLIDGQVPHEFQQYAKLLRHIGLGNWWPTIEAGVKRDNSYVMRYYEYFRRHSGADDNAVRRNPERLS